MPEISRRDFTLLTAAGLVAITGPAAALTVAEARALVDRVVADINGIINSGRSEPQMIGDFEGILTRYGDMPTIAQSVLGPPARSASRGQMRAFTDALQGYLARKYGRRFREFIGGQIAVTGAEQISRYFEIAATVNLRGEAPFQIHFRVWDRSGQTRFIDLLIEGISLVITERTEVGALMDRNGGDLNATIAALGQIT